MTSYMKIAVGKIERIEELEKSFKETISILAPIGKTVFRGSNNVFSTSLYDCVTIGISRNLGHYKAERTDVVISKIEALKNSENFKKASGSASAKRIKVVQGKGAKDRFTLLSGNLLDKLRQYYVATNRPKEYLFTSPQTGRAFHPRSMQLVVSTAMHKAGFTPKGYTAHTLRHSFATHMLDNGSNIHVIKTLLGHSQLSTTMVYLHLQQHTQYGIVSPMDKLLNRSDGTTTA
jgi:integrase